jgi:hypothetical protein
MSWVEVTPEEVRAARIEAKALRSAGLKVDPLVQAIASAEPHSKEWIESQEGQRAAETTNDISEAMDRELRSMLRGEPQGSGARIHMGREPRESATGSGRARRTEVGQGAARPEPSRSSWWRRLFGR